MAANTNPKNSILDIAADLIDSSGLDLGTVVDLAASAVSGSNKKSGSSRKKDSNSDSLISKLIPDKKDYPQFSEKTYWAIREKFKKSIPEKVIATTLTNATGLKAETVKATVLPALDQMGLTKDSKPTAKLKTWINDDKYAEACASICSSVYPAALTKLPLNTEIQKAAALKWFVKNAGVSETTAKKMMAVYLLLAIPELKKSAAEKKAASSPAKKPASTARKPSAPAAETDSVKVTKRAGKATITVKIIADEGITKKALTDVFTAAAADAYNQMK